MILLIIHTNEISEQKSSTDCILEVVNMVLGFSRTHLFIYGLQNDAPNTSDYRMSNDKLRVNNEIEKL
jgi:hypothetical protein